MADACWQLDKTVARLSVEGFSASIDLTRPAAGLSLQIAGAPQEQLCNILGVDFENANSSDNAPRMDAARLDAYVRDNDLVVTYDEAPPLHVRAQMYWRRLQAGEFSPQSAQEVAAAIELIVSVNTSLLDSDPQSNVLSSILSAGQLLGIVDETHSGGISTQLLDRGSAKENVRGFIVRHVQEGPSYIEIVHPAESCRSEARRAGESATPNHGVKLVHHLFGQRLEKGVILRARLRAGLVARQHDEAIAQSAYRAFAATEPPLTV